MFKPLWLHRIFSPAANPTDFTKCWNFERVRSSIKLRLSVKVTLQFLSLELSPKPVGTRNPKGAETRVPLSLGTPGQGPPE